MKPIEAKKARSKIVEDEAVWETAKALALTVPASPFGGRYLGLENPSKRPNARFGLLAHISRRTRHVRFAPKSRHVRCTRGCPLRGLLWAIADIASHQFATPICASTCRKEGRQNLLRP